MRIWPIWAAAVLVASFAAWAAGEWQDALGRQAQAEQGCEVAFLTQVQERATATGNAVAAKVHCVDGRAFDALRGGAGEPFTLKLCTPVDARAC